MGEEFSSNNAPVLVMACDGAFAMPLATALRSLVEANRDYWPIEVYVITSDFPEQARSDVQKSLPDGAARIKWEPVDIGLLNRFSSIEHKSSEAKHISIMACARLLIPEIVPEGVARVLYLDADILVLKSLRALWETDLQDAVVGAVMDTFAEDARHEADPRCEGVPPVQHYFNSGVLLIDLDRWRRERVSESAIAYLLEHPRTPYPDQDALNAACDGRWKPIEPGWNFQSHMICNIMQLNERDRPGIIHFITAKKPWIARTINDNSKLFNAYRARTAFARTRPQKIKDYCVDKIFRAKWGLMQNSSFRATYSMVRPLLVTFENAYIGAAKR